MEIISDEPSTIIGNTNFFDPQTVAYRNLEYADADGLRINCEIEHPKWGWIPTTVDPQDVEQLHIDLMIRIMREGQPIAAYVAPTQDQLRADMPPLSARALRLALIRNSISIASIDAAIAAMPDGLEKEETQTEWEYATEFERLSPTLVRIATVLGLTPEQVDAMWAVGLLI